MLYYFHLQCKSQNLGSLTSKPVCLAKETLKQENEKCLRNPNGHLIA